MHQPPLPQKGHSSSNPLPLAFLINRWISKLPRRKPHCNHDGMCWGVSSHSHSSLSWAMASACEQTQWHWQMGETSDFYVRDIAAVLSAMFGH